MNSEELELSLRTEFESYLKGVLAGMRQDVSEFQKNFEAEFEKHKAQMDDAFRNLTSRFESDTQFDQAFTQSVMEHLRLAKDDGAELAAIAFGEAEKLRLESTSPARYDQIRDAINDISTKTTQSTILRALVQHAGQFTPRGAFFIVKNDHFVGWKAFGREAAKNDAEMRDIHIPVSAGTLLAGSVNELAACQAAHGTYAEDALFLEAMEFGQPERMYAIPLVARGRGVAVLYADHGTTGADLNIEALETMVRVAGLTVELLAASQTAKTQQASEPAAEEHSVTAPETQAVAEEYHAESEPEAAAVQEYQAEEQEPEQEAAEQHEDEPAEHFEEYTGAVAIEEPAAAEEYLPEVQPEAPEQTEDVGYFEPVAESEAHETESTEITTDFAFASSDSYDSGDAPAVEPEPEYAYVSEESNGSRNGSYEPAAAETVPVVNVAAPQQTRGRYSDRNVDLPIEVADNERRFHNDARRFARLLVSEIKLYNEQKVNEGRQAGDLYDRLREAIERSREMYDKRVLPEVASKFDYFHYELVSNLADGDAERLGGNYPGSNA